MKYQIVFKAKKAIELLSKLNNKGDLFGLLHENDLYYINSNVASRAIEMLIYDLTNENREPLADLYSIECDFCDVRAISDFWCLFSKHDFYDYQNCHSRYDVAQKLWQGAGGNNFEFENHAIRAICLSLGEKLKFNRALDDDDCDIQEELDELAQDRYTWAIELVGKAFYSILTSLDLLTVKEITG